MTAAEIDRRVMGALNTFYRALERGDIDEDTCKDCIDALAKWSTSEYLKLPQVVAMETLMNVMFGRQQS